MSDAQEVCMLIERSIKGLHSQDWYTMNVIAASLKMMPSIRI